MAGKDDLEIRMRRKEVFHSVRVLDNTWIVVRADGRSFSRMTATEFEKPFDPRFHEMMREAARSLMLELNGVYAYTQSDEISLLMPRKSDLFDREVEKIVSITASIVSAAFSLRLGKPVAFDSRIWCGASRKDVIDYFAWRQGDASRCALHGWCYWTLRKQGMNEKQATAELEGKRVDEKNELLHRAGINFNTLPAWQRRGVGAYFEQFEKEALDPRSGRAVKASRRRLTIKEDLPMKAAYAEFIDKLLAGDEERR